MAIDLTTIPSEAAVRQAILSGEGPQAELKPNVPTAQDVARLVSGFANASGGLIVVGVRKFPFAAIGVDWQQLKCVFAEVCQRVRPAQDLILDQVSIDERIVGVIRVKPSAALVTSEAGAFIRVGDRTEVMRTQQMEARLRVANGAGSSLDLSSELADLRQRFDEFRQMHADMQSPRKEMSIEPRQCAQCGAELTADAPNGLCPPCRSIAQADKRSAEKLAETAPFGAHFSAPKPKELARYFPQLEIIELLGQGGMGAVYKARQPTLDRLVAVKILPTEVAGDPGFSERFAREARALARLNHPPIVGIHDFGQADGLYYFVMEYVDGASLRQLVSKRQLTSRQALALVPQICEALQFAHDEGIVHRDIKPENILIDKRGRVKVADFGLAKLLGRSTDEATLTRVEQVMGTPLYMAPEQMQGSHAVDHRADIYSLGVVFYEMLTGELPLGRFVPPSQKVEVDVRLDEVVLRAPEREPDRRYQQASDVKTDVEAIASGPARVATPPPASATISCPVPLRRAAIAMLFLGFLGCTSPITVLFLFGAVPDIVRHSEILLTLATPIFLAAGAAAGLAGWGMLRCRWYVFAVVVSALAFLSGFAGNVFGLLIGGWALVVLSRSDVRAAFAAVRKARMGAIDTIPSATSVSSLSQVRGPAIGLLATGILNWMVLPFWVVFAVVQSRMLGFIGSVAIPVVVLLASTCIIFGALKMMRYQAYGFAVIGSILAIIIIPGNIIGLPIGVWALVVLTQPDVRAAFPTTVKRHRSLGERIAFITLSVLLLAMLIPILIQTSGCRPQMIPRPVRDLNPRN